MKRVVPNTAHPFRGNEASVIFKGTDSHCVIRILPGNMKIEDTVRYLGIDIE